LVRSSENNFDQGDIEEGECDQRGFAEERPCDYMFLKDGEELQFIHLPEVVLGFKNEYDQDYMHNIVYYKDS